MGTRNLTVAIVDGNYKIAQYGQWDGYFSGQGEIVVKFILSMDKEKFKEALKKCRFLTNEEVENKWIECGMKKNEQWVSMDISKAFGKKYPALSRDTGSDVLNLVYEGHTELKDSYLFAADSLFCEYAYVIDMDNEVLEIYTGFVKEPHSNDRFSDLPIEKGASDTIYYPVKLFASIPFDNLNETTMKELEKQKQEQEEQN